MKRALYVFAGCFVGGLAAPSAAQQSNQSPPPPPIIQGAGAPANPTPAPPPVNDEASKPPVAKPKTCEPVLIRAGPNQGQLVSKCHHTERSRDGQTSG